MYLKPRYVFFYTNDEAVEGLVNQSPFIYDKPLSFRKSKEEARIEYKHFDIDCFKVYSNFGDRFRGIKAWQILVEECLYNRLTQEDIDCRLKPMMSPYSNLGGRIISIHTYREEEN